MLLLRRCCFLSQSMSLRFSLLFVGTNLKKHALVYKYPCVRASDGLCAHTIYSTPLGLSCMSEDFMVPATGRKSQADWEKISRDAKLGTR